MKQSPQEKAQQERLNASRFSAEGFMGTDRRPVDEIVAADRRAREAQGAPLELAPGIEARHYEAMGRMPSPFPGDGVFPKGETRIEWSDGRCARATALGIALIERHGFFQGRGSPYRIEPEQAAALPPG